MGWGSFAGPSLEILMRRSLQKLQTFVQHPATQLATGMILLVSGITEVCYDFMGAERPFRLGVHHGVALFGLVQVLGSLPNVVDGLERGFKAWESHHAQKEANPEP